jgi:diguanylate cyclase (GGDEF)-like protein
MKEDNAAMTETQSGFRAMNGKRRILLVEDEPINQDILAMILEDTYEVIPALTGAEALETVEAEAETLSLILLDLNLPDMHGLDVLRRLKGDARYARLPVIVMTADKDAEVESLTVGAIDFIPKPYPQPKVIHARVLRTIELSEDRDTIRLTERDHLTGLYNREYFFRYAEQYDNYHRDAPTDAVVLDINHFHMINERYGKVLADQLLTGIAGQLREFAAGAGGIVCRREADTFLLYCPHQEDYAELLERLSLSPEGDGKGGAKARLRMGVYYNTDRSIDLELRFDRAKMAADKVRSSVRNAIGIYDDSLHDSEVFAEQLLEEFPAAIREGQFLVYFQPKFDVRPDEPVLSSAEALVRWKHPRLGMVSPGVFIPLFEDSGLIGELDSYVWRATAAHIRDWKERLGISVPVSVNVSRINMYDNDLAERLKAIVEENGLSCGDLLLEVTESAYTEDSGQIINVVNQLREAGFHIEMDDFGSGYSSLNMISLLPIDALKLDMEFIRSAFKARKDTRLLEVVIRMAEALEVPTIAEGVETAEQMFTLKAMGCDIVQGYYFSRPVPAAEFEQFLLEKRQGRSGLHRQEKDASRYSYTYADLHDPLTGLYNRSAFDILFRDSDKSHIAVMLTRFNGLEALKSGQGYDRADQAVKRTAEVLRQSFRSTDSIYRLDEDRFAVIMTRITSGMKKLVMEKAEQVNSLLRQPEDGLPPVSLSAGIAFSDLTAPDGDVFRDAENALNRQSGK